MFGLQVGIIWGLDDMSLNVNTVGMSEWVWRL